MTDARSYPDLPRADSYGGVLVDARGRVLLREPTNHFGGYAWTFAKGRPDVGETASQTALREVREETGLGARILMAIPERFDGTTGSTAFFLMEAVGSPAEFGWETATICWAEREEAERLIDESPSATGQARDRRVLAAALAAFDQLPASDRPAVRSTDWELRPLPAARTTIALDLRLDAAALQRVRKGFLPTASAPDWFAWFDPESLRLNLHHSRSGIHVHAVEFELNADGGARAIQAIVNRDPAQYGNTDESEDRRQIATLIARWPPTVSSD
ncbi:MAG: NUDIX hydrolase [Burkholderiaceae bacterium]